MSIFSKLFYQTSNQPFIFFNTQNLGSMRWLVRRVGDSLVWQKVHLGETFLYHLCCWKGGNDVRDLLEWFRDIHLTDWTIDCDLLLPKNSRDSNVSLTQSYKNEEESPGSGYISFKKDKRRDPNLELISKLLLNANLQCLSASGQKYNYQSPKNSRASPNTRPVPWK